MGRSHERAKMPRGQDPLQRLLDAYRAAKSRLKLSVIGQGPKLKGGLKLNRSIFMINKRFQHLQTSQNIFQILPNWLNHAWLNSSFARGASGPHSLCRHLLGAEGPAFGVRAPCCADVGGGRAVRARDGNEMEMTSTSAH